MSGGPLLAVDDLVAGYEPGVAILRGVSIRVEAGEIVVILGPNGAGKSTLVKAVAGLVPKFAGRVSLAGADISGRKPHELVRAGLAFVPQTENVFTTMSVADNLKLAVAILPKAERHARMEETLALFPDLARQRELRAGRLSGGQRQMLAVARALMIKPQVLILDEASAGLSPKLVQTVFAKVQEIRAGGMTIVLVEQNARAALSIGDRAYVLVDGRNRHEAPAAELIRDPALGRLYLGAGDAVPLAGIGR